MANPFLVLGGIAISVATAAFGILQVPGWVAAAQDAAAINDVAQVSAAQAAMVSERGTYASSFGELAGSGSVKVTPSGGVRLYVGADVTGKHHLTVARSASGAYFARISGSATIGRGATIEETVAAAGTTVTGPVGTRVTAEGVPVPTVGDFRELAHTNLHRSPGGLVQSNNWHFWSGGTADDSDVRFEPGVPSTWSQSGTATRMTWNEVMYDTSYFASFASDATSSRERVTIRFRFVVNQPVTVSEARLWSAAGATIVASSHEEEFIAKPGEPTEGWITLDPPAAGVSAGVRGGFQISGHTPGFIVEMSDGDVYMGDHDSSRPWFSGSSAPDGLQTEWAGEPGNSTSHAFRP